MLSGIGLSVKTLVESITGGFKMSDLEDDEDGPCPNCEDGCERCDPRFLSKDEKE